MAASPALTHPRALVYGDRHCRDREFVWTALDLHYAVDPFELVVGYDPRDEKWQGVDQLAYEWAKDRGHKGACYPAHWRTLGRKAGPLRNQRMLEMAAPVRGIGFPGGGLGSADMRRRLDAAGIPVAEHSVRSVAAAPATS